MQTYQFHLDNLEISHAGKIFAVEVHGLIEYTVTPYYAGSYEHGLAPEPCDVNIEDVHFENVKCFTDGGIEHVMVKDGVTLLDSLDSVRLSTILELVEDTNEFYDLSFNMLEQAETDEVYYDDDDRHYD